MAGNQSSSSSDKIKEKLEQLEKKLIEKNQLINELTESLKKSDIISENKSVKDIRINVSGIDIEWETNIGTCIFEKLPVIMMWVGTTLAGLMSGIQAMVGPERFNLALQSQGRNSVETDWRVISQFADFNDGFAAIANIAAVAGWGVCKLVSLDKERKECRIIVRNSWEGLYQKALGVCWGSGMIAGKMSGVCSRLFETSCWAEQKKYIAKGDEFDEFIVRPSERSIEKEIENLLATDKGTRADVAVALQTMRAEAMERKNAEECLRESEEKYRLLVENANSIILRWDAEGNITYLNPYGLTFFGYILEEVIGRNVVGTIVPNTESITSRDLTLLMKDIQKDPDKFKNNENENIKKDGKRVWVSWTNRAVTDKNGNIVEILSIGNDITEKKNLEIRLQRAEKMEAIGTLAGGVAHDLNNILSGIVSYPDLLLMQISKDSPLRKPIVTIQKSGEKAAAIVQDLLTLARRGVAITEVVNLNAIVQEYINSPEYEKLKLLHPGIEIVANLDKDLLNIKGSSSQLFVTVMNLISNAAESIPNHGSITILTKNIYIDTLLAGYDDVTEGDYALLKVSDNGTGIPPEDINSIFEPFYTKKKMGRSGTGLGMSVVWGTIKDHKGYIDINSKIGEGTTLFLYFPASRIKLSEGRIRLPVENYMGRGESILVIDDVEEQRQIAYSILSELGYLVTTVSSGEYALDYLKNNSADLLILDMIMFPGMDGLDTYRKILKLHPGQKAIIASGFSETDRVKKAQELGAGKYLSKPYTFENIGMAVRNELNRQ